MSVLMRSVTFNLKMTSQADACSANYDGSHYIATNMKPRVLRMALSVAYLFPRLAESFGFKMHPVNVLPHCQMR